MKDIPSLPPKETETPKVTNPSTSSLVVEIPISNFQFFAPKVTVRVLEALITEVTMSDQNSVEAEILIGALSRSGFTFSQLAMCERMRLCLELYVVFLIARLSRSTSVLLEVFHISS